MHRRIGLFSLALGLCAGFPASAQFTLVPEAPRVDETIYVRATPGDGCDTPRTRDFATSMSNNRITVVMPVNVSGVCFATSPPAVPVHVAIGQLPPGDYQIEVLRQTDTATTSLGTRSFTVQARKPVDPLANYSDLWWNPEQSGWGLNIVQHPDNAIFATWFEYDADGRPGWYVVPGGAWSAADQNRNFANHFFNGPVYRTSGPTGGTVDPSQVTRTLVGTAAFQFFEWDRMNATITINGHTRQLTLQRQAF